MPGATGCAVGLLTEKQSAIYVDRSPSQAKPRGIPASASRAHCGYGRVRRLAPETASCSCPCGISSTAPSMACTNASERAATRTRAERRAWAADMCCWFAEGSR